MGIDAIPPPASGLSARLVLGPALRAQSDGRLVRLVREGYESAFDEIVRRYRRPLDRFAAGFVGGRSEDVTQDSFRKALEALRRGGDEVELRPWLYRIVRNTALNDLRDRPPAAAELADDLIAGGRSAAAEAEERAEVAALTARLRALPENQRAALVMRELEGMSHEEIAATLGISHGAARQAIARGRATVRSGFGALVPLPLLRALASGGDGAAEAAAGAGGAALGGTAVSSGAAMVGGGIGGGALKVGLATVVVAGSLGAGVAIQQHGDGHRSGPPKAAASAPGGPRADGVRSTPSSAVAEVDDSRGSGSEDGARHHGDSNGRQSHGRDDDHGGRGRGRGSSHDDHGHHRGHGGGDDPLPTIAPVQSSVSDHHGRSRGGPGPSDDGTSGSDSSGHGGSDDSRSVGTSGHGSRGSGGSGSGSGSGGGDGSGSGSSSSGRGGRGSGEVTEPVVETATASTATSTSSSSGSGTSGGPGPDSSATESGSSGDDSTSLSGSSGGSGSGGGSGSSDHS